jgi:hypothetical protein
MIRDIFYYILPSLISAAFTSVPILIVITLWKLGMI